MTASILPGAAAAADPWLEFENCFSWFWLCWRTVYDWLFLAGVVASMSLFVVMFLVKKWPYCSRWRKIWDRLVSPQACSGRCWRLLLVFAASSLPLAVVWQCWVPGRRHCWWLAANCYYWRFEAAEPRFDEPKTILLLLCALDDYFFIPMVPDMALPGHARVIIFKQIDYLF